MSEEPEQNVVVEMPAGPKPAAEPSTVAESPAVQQEQPAAPIDLDFSRAKKRGKSGVVLDCTLVAALVAVLAGGAWYVNRSMQQYRVPTPMEIAMAEHTDLAKRRDSLELRARKADEQLRMRKRDAALDAQLAQINRQIAEKEQSVNSLHSRVLALQHEIRQEDKTSRSVAKGLLPGLPIGDAATTTGKRYNNAVIHRLEGNLITLRTPEGQTRFPVTQLVKDKLPDIARYAFGLDDMVDMSDFEVVEGSPKPKARKGRLIAPRTAAKEEKTTSIDPASYEPEGRPVVDTDANKTTTATGTGEDDPAAQPQANPDRWTPPTGDLPL